MCTPVVVRHREIGASTVEGRNTRELRWRNRFSGGAVD